MDLSSLEFVKNSDLIIPQVRKNDVTPIKIDVPMMKMSLLAKTLV